MKLIKYILLPLCLSVTASAFAGEWTDKLTVTGVSKYSDPQSMYDNTEVFFKSAPTTTSCQTESKSLIIESSSYEEYRKMFTEALIHHKKVQVYTDCSRGDGVIMIYGVKITNDFAL